MDDNLERTYLCGLRSDELARLPSRPRPPLTFYFVLFFAQPRRASVARSVFKRGFPIAFAQDLPLTSRSVGASIEPLHASSPILGSSARRHELPLLVRPNATQFISTMSKLNLSRTGR